MIQFAMVEHHLLGVRRRPLGVGHCEVVQKVIENRPYRRQIVSPDGTSFDYVISKRFSNPHNRRTCST